MILRASFLLFILIFLLLRLLKYFSVELPNWVLFYVNDFICMPIVLFLCLLATQTFAKRPVTKLPYLPILFLTSFYAIYFELLLPRFAERYTADFLDVLMYFGGSLLFIALQELDLRYFRKQKKLPQE